MTGTGRLRTLHMQSPAELGERAGETSGSQQRPRLVGHKLVYGKAGSPRRRRMPTAFQESWRDACGNETAVGVRLRKEDKGRWNAEKVQGRVFKHPHMRRVPSLHGFDS